MYAHDDQVSARFRRSGQHFAMSLAVSDQRCRRAAVSEVVRDQGLELFA
jgi:hypothetical protein